MFAEDHWIEPLGESPWRPGPLHSDAKAEPHTQSGDPLPPSEEGHHKNRRREPFEDNGQGGDATGQDRGGHPPPLEDREGLRRRRGAVRYRKARGHDASGGGMVRDPKVTMNLGPGRIGAAVIRSRDRIALKSSTAALPHPSTCTPGGGRRGPRVRRRRRGGRRGTPTR